MKGEHYFIYFYFYQIMSGIRLITQIIAALGFVKFEIQNYNRNIVKCGAKHHTSNSAHCLMVINLTTSFV